MFDWIGDILDGLFGIVQDAISTALGNFIGKLCYYAVTALLKVIEVVYRFFEVFSGGSMVKYQNSDKFLVDVFFGNNRINQVYLGHGAHRFRDHCRRDDPRGDQEEL